MNFSSVQPGNRLLPIRLTLARSDKFGKKNSKSIEKCTSIRIVCPTLFSLYFRKFYMKNSYRRYCSGHRRRFGYRRRRRRQNDLCQSRNHRSFGHPDGPRLSHSTADDAHVRRLQRQRKKNNYLQQKLSIASDIHAEETKGTFAKSRLCRPLFSIRHRCGRCRADVRRRIEKIGLLK